MEINRIFENNKKWIASKLDNDKDFFNKLGEGQSPEILYIGCSDSRVTAEELTGLGPGITFYQKFISEHQPVSPSFR